jgi:hypothetical protein
VDQAGAIIEKSFTGLNFSYISAIVDSVESKNASFHANPIMNLGDMIAAPVTAAGH